MGEEHKPHQGKPRSPGMLEGFSNDMMQVKKPHEVKGSDANGNPVVGRGATPQEAEKDYKRRGGR